MTRICGRLVAARLAGCALAVSMMFALAGCYEERLVWSPDGRRAFVRTEKGDLHLCGADGALSAVLSTKVHTAAWVGDSESLVLAREKDEGGDSVVLARLQDGGRALEIVRTVFNTSGKDTVVHLRVAPGGRAVAVAVDVDERDEESFAVHVASLEEGKAPLLVAEEASASPDWTRDGRALVYWQAGGRVLGKDDLRLGTLMRREILQEAQGIVAADAGQSLAAGLFNPFGRVRCLGDGRMLFNSTEADLPLAAPEVEGSRDQLFAFDPHRQATLVRLVPRGAESDLPDALAFFEPSPDGASIVFGDSDGRVVVLTLATGETEVVQEPDGRGLQGAPVWRLTGELCYFRRTRRTAELSEERAGEFVLRGPSGETVLSASWPTAVLNAVVE